MNAFAIANQPTGLYIAIVTADQHNAQYGTDIETGYIVRSHGEGYEEVTTLAEAIAQATEWAEDAKEDADAADVAELDAFLTRLAA